jgi:phenylpropionate dioxygenase-like ring-hydroxylating dioxygenase large terminal subunit
MATRPARAQDRSAGISYQELIRNDLVPPPAVLQLESPFDAPIQSVPVTRYTRREFHELEMEKLWPRVWQMACREEEIPEVGDYSVYEIGRYSIIVVRTAQGIRAHHNVCRHRGRRLCDFDGHAASFICPFHGFSWNLDGTSRSVTSQWDFPQIDPKDFSLTPVKCDTWGGWVFVNMDVNAEPLSDFLGDLPAHFEVWSPEDRYVQAHVGKIMNCNWKLCQEAFMEAFHVITTHPQLLAGIGDENSQYDAWGNFSRAITPNGTPSPHLRWTPDQQDLFESVMMRNLDDPPAPAVPQGMSARAALAAASRAALQEVVGPDKVIADAEVSDSIYYTLFPNFHPWGGYNRIVYRFRPWKDRHDQSLMECYYLSPFSGERPAPAPLHLLGDDEPWTNAPELGVLAKVFTQDTFNLPNVQRGLEAAQFESVMLARYQETKIRHFHHLLSRQLGLE